MYKVYIYFIKRLCAFAWIRGRYRRRFCYIHIFQWHKKNETFRFGEMAQCF